MHIFLTFDHVKEKEMQLNLYNEPAIFMPHIQFYILDRTVWTQEE